MTKPISPNEVKKETTIPNYVIESFNYLIQKNWNGTCSTIYLKDVIQDIEKRSGFALEDREYLNVEPIYRENGWKVKYDKPAYNENYSAFYMFSRGEMK
jgi:hypothetical protein